MQICYFLNQELDFDFIKMKLTEIYKNQIRSTLKIDPASKLSKVQ